MSVPRRDNRIVIAVIHIDLSQCSSQYSYQLSALSFRLSVERLFERLFENCLTYKFTLVEVCTDNFSLGNQSYGFVCNHVSNVQYK